MKERETGLYGDCLVKHALSSVCGQVALAQAGMPTTPLFTSFALDLDIDHPLRLRMSLY